MKRTLAILAVLAATSTLGMAGAQASAEPNGPTVGNCISDIIYGNEPNVDADGNTVPSQSPGPWVNNPADPDNPTWGHSVGQWQQEAGGGSVTAACRAYAGR